MMISKWNFGKFEKWSYFVATAILMPLVMSLLVAKTVLAQTNYLKIEAKEKGASEVPRFSRITQQATTNRTLVNVGQLAMWIYADGRSANTPGGSSGLTFPRGTLHAGEWHVGIDVRVDGRVYLVAGRSLYRLEL